MWIKLQSSLVNLSATQVIHKVDLSASVPDWRIMLDELILSYDTEERRDYAYKRILKILELNLETVNRITTDWDN